MSVRYLYEFDFLGSSIYRMVEGTSLQAMNYTWTGVSKIEELDLYLNIKDDTGSFMTWMADRAIDKVFVTRYRYDTESDIADEIIKNLYSNLSADSTTATLRKCDVPETQLEDAQKLIADGIVQLYEIKLADGTTYYYKQDNTAFWNGHTWTGIPILFEGYSTAQGDSYSRPTLSIANPDKMSEIDGYSRSTLSSLINPMVVRDNNDNIIAEYPYGLLYRAKVTRYLVLYEDFRANKLIYQKKKWIVWHIKTINKNFIQVELRNYMDGVNFDVPARMYIPPEFPFVTLK